MPAWSAASLAALDAAPSRVPVVLGGCGTGRTHAAACAGRSARPARAASTSTSSARRAPPNGSSTRCSPARRSSIPGSSRGEVPTPANARDAFDRTLAFFQRARTADGHAGDVPARRSARAADLRELPRPALRAARDGAGRRRQPQPLRLHQPLRHPRPSRRCATRRRASRWCTCRRSRCRDVAAMLPPGRGRPPVASAAIWR